MTIIYIFISILIISLISLIGVLTLKFSKKAIIFLVSFSAGVLLGESFLHILPEIVEINNSYIIWMLVLSGIIFFFILEKIIFWRHCHIPTSHKHPHPIGIMNLVGDGIHNFIDGAIIAGAYLLNFELGIATTIAVMAHEIPQEIGDFGVLVHAGYSRGKALFFNFCTSIISIFGAILIFLIGSRLENIFIYILAIAAGGFIYIATVDLMPELKKESHTLASLGQLLSIIGGIISMVILKIIIE